MKKKISMSWYLVQYKNNRHTVAINNLKRQGFNTFFPVIERTKREKLKFSNEIAPLFPGYIFVSFDINDFHWIKIKSTIGISKILTANQKPLEVSSEIIQDIQKRCNKDGKIITNKRLNIGESIKVIKGPFTGFIGKIEEIRDKDRIIILLKFMENNNRASLDKKYIENI